MSNTASISGKKITALGKTITVPNQHKQSGKYKSALDTNGCGVCCASMALALQGKKVTPAALLKAGVKKWGKWPRAAAVSVQGLAKLIKDNGVPATAYRSTDAAAAKKVIDTALKNGQPVICWTSPNGHTGDPFATGDHYVLAVGYNSVGKIVVANSGNKGPANTVTLAGLIKFLKAGTATDSGWWRTSAASAGYVVTGRARKAVTKAVKLNIVDLSHHNTVTSWDSLAMAVDGVVLRAGYRGQSGSLAEDKKFLQHMRSAINAGVKRIGVYWWSTHLTATEAKADAAFLRKLLAPYKEKINFGVWLDSEAAKKGAHGTTADKLSAAARTQAHLAFMTEMQASGYTVGLYCSESWFKTHLQAVKFSAFPLWIAKYGSVAPKVNRVYAGWQYTASGRVSGVGGSVDRSYFYSEITAPKKATTTAKKEHNMDTLRKGDTGQQVRALQKILGGLTVDGEFGAKTEAAVKAYQRQYKLTVDGIVGPKTWAVLLK